MKRAKDIMNNRDPFILRNSDTIVYAAQEFRMRKIDGAPVLDEKEELNGIFSKGHIIGAIAQGLSGITKVSELMSSPVITVTEDTLLQEIWKAKVGTLPVLDEKGKVVGIITRNDVLLSLIYYTEQSRDQLQTILESTYNGIIAVDRKGIIKIWNSSAERIIKKAAKDTIGKPVMDVIPNTRLLETLNTGESEYGGKLQIGKIIAVTNRAPIVKDGEIIGAVAVIQDISDFEKIASELKNSRQLNKELDAIIDSVYDGLFITDGKGFTTRLNKSYTRISGIQAKEVMGKHIQELVDTGYCSEGVTPSVLEQKKAVTIMHTVKGHKKLLVTGNPVFDDDGEIIYVVTTARDMTDLINLKEKLDKTKELTRIYHLELEQLRKQQMSETEVIGQSKAIKNVLDISDRVSHIDATVLISGETGVGKEVIAQYIHKRSPRNKGPFIKVNCAAIPENLLESELFGYEKGAFTGAHINGKPGMFELANTGTILLDEIGDLSLGLQAKLLRVVQEKEITRIGSTSVKKVDFRIIAATNVDLEKKIIHGVFREDLFYRLNVISICIPPLRQRREDILLLVKHFLDVYNKKYNYNKQFNLLALDELIQYDWPGNVREIKNLVERLVILTSDEVITCEHLKGLIRKSNQMPNTNDWDNGLTLDEAIAQVEKRLILKYLIKFRSTRKAAKELGTSQSTVIRRAQKYGLNLPK